MTDSTEKPEPHLFKVGDTIFILSADAEAYAKEQGVRAIIHVHNAKLRAEMLEAGLQSLTVGAGLP